MPFARATRRRLDYLAGDRVRASVRLSSGGSFRNFGAFSYERYLQTPRHPPARLDEIPPPRRPAYPPPRPARSGPGYRASAGASRSELERMLPRAGRKGYLPDPGPCSRLSSSAKTAGWTSRPSRTSRRRASITSSPSPAGTSPSSTCCSSRSSASSACHGGRRAWPWASSSSSTPPLSRAARPCSGPRS